MDQTYIIAFAPGTSGKFLTNVFWEILQQHDFEWELSANNTSHKVFLTGCSHAVDLNKPIAIKNPYDFFKFDTAEKINGAGELIQRQGTGLFTTHAWPNFDSIRSNPSLTQTKFIIVTVDPDSLWEIFLNDFFKNFLITLDPGIDDQLKTNKPVWLLITYNELFQPSITYEELFLSLTKEKIEILARSFYERLWTLNPNNLTEQKGLSDLYRNPVEIPDDFKHRTLLLEYKDVYTISDSEVPVAVEKMAQFMNQSSASSIIRKRKIDKSFFSESVVKKCKFYMQGRQDLINNTFKFYNLM